MGLQPLVASTYPVPNPNGVRMPDPEQNFLARLDSDGLDALERKLAIKVSQLQSEGRVFRGGSKKTLTGQVDTDADLQKAATDVIETARRGVKIVPQTESRPLIPLFKAAKKELSPELIVDHEQMGFVFYVVEVIFNILLPRDQWPQSANFGLKLSDDIGDPARRLRPISLFPGRKDIQFFKVDLEGAVGIDAGLNVTIPLDKTTIFPFGSFSAKAKINSNIAIGPLSFPFRKAAIEVIGEGDQNILWRYNLRSELKGTNVFKSILILKVAKEARSIRMAGALEVVPCKHRWLDFFGAKNLPRLTDQRALPVQLALN